MCEKNTKKHFEKSGKKFKFGHEKSESEHPDLPPITKAVVPNKFLCSAGIGIRIGPVDFGGLAHETHFSISIHIKMQFSSKFALL